ncbi:methyltransferase family protein [Vibrio mexicanus]|uniref:methyltransferase family protein n=1 Tax=Vibrio mexicanus TaxID=1004326 RepID=UPI00063C4011|nr:isoprenylcysteine carboxylmethyltransferase family protein [Vibrio mexicanus]
MSKLELKVPPVALFLIFVVVMHRLSRMLPSANVDLPFAAVVALVCFVMSGVIGLAGVWEFRRAKTTVNPTKPENASLVVDTGVFAYTRNPMYVALLMLLIGLGYWLGNWASLLCPVLFVLYMNRFQIQPEERVLESLFGNDYIAFKQRVRRWI